MNTQHPQQCTKTAVRPSPAILQPCFQILCARILLTPKGQHVSFLCEKLSQLQRNCPICQDHFDFYYACDFCCCDMQVLHRCFLLHHANREGGERGQWQATLGPHRAACSLQTTRMEEHAIRQCHESCMSRGGRNTRAVD